MNINFNIIENNENNTENNNLLQLDSLMKEIDETPFNFLSNDVNELEKLTKGLIYDINYTLKQLILICDFYGISKEIKTNKLKKNMIIEFIVDFEENSENFEIVNKRKQYWHFMEELKKDKFMKKYIIW